MNKKKFALATTMAIMALSLSSVALADSVVTPSTIEERAALREEMHTQMEALIEQGDYNAWKEFVTENHPNAPILDSITADNFAQFVKAHELMEQAHDILEEAGIDQGPAFGKGRGHGMMKGPMGMGR